MQTYAIIQCTNPECNLRCPVTDGQRMDRCPWCHAPALIDVAGAIEQEPAAEPSSATLPLTLILDNVRSAFNVGSILRSANGVGVREVWLTGFTPRSEHPRVAKTALGAEKTLTTHAHNNAPDVVRELKRAGATILVLESAAKSESIFEVALPVDASLVLVAGNEVVGVDPAIRALADALVELPMRGNKLSYNVAVATGAALILLGERLAQSASLLSRNQDR